MMHQAVEYERGLVTLWALMGELLTAVHHRLPVKVVIFDNAAFGLITLEAQSEGLLPFRQAIELPNPDYEALARACGAQGFSVRDPARLQSTLVEAFACSGPAIVDCVVVADEMPNLPHVELDQVRGYALSRIKEAIAAVTGG